MVLNLNSISFANLFSTKSILIIGILAVSIIISGLIQFSTSSDRVAEIHHYDITGNLGGGEAYDVHLANGEEIHLTRYTDRHPLCQDNDNNSSQDCSEYGETETSSGFENAKQVYKNSLGLSYGSFEKNRFGPIATCYNDQSSKFYTCIPSPVNIVSISTKSLLN